MSGTLHIVGTPIGNLGDFSPRAVETLQQVSLILAEDTRHSQRLCQHFGIRTPLRAWHAHNEAERLDEVVGQLREGQSLALITDAGMPLISDPGFPLVRACHQAGVRVSVVPGPAACIAALAVSGLPGERFAFEGFPPAKAQARRQALAQLRHEPRTLIFYEAPHRLAATLDDCVRVFGAERPAALARELTKRFESVYRGSLAELAAWAHGEGEDRRGEFVLLIAAAPAPAVEAGADLAPDLLRLARALREEWPPRKVAKFVARHSPHPAADIYQALLADEPPQSG